MSLDIYLNTERLVDLFATSIDNIKITTTVTESINVYHANITHNLNEMADSAGIYRHLWRPEELGIEKAGELIKPLRDGLQLMLNDPDRFTSFNPKNEWGSYSTLITFLHNYIHACKKNPDAEIVISR